MRRIALVVLVVTAFAVPAAHANAAKAPTAAQFAALKKQVTKLQTQLAKDEKALTTLEDNVGITIAVQVCANAFTADALQGTWQEIDMLAVSLGKPAIFGPQTPVNDVQTCTPLRIPRSQALPPTTQAFSALAALLSG